MYYFPNMSARTNLAGAALSIVLSSVASGQLAQTPSDIANALVTASDPWHVQAASQSRMLDTLSASANGGPTSLKDLPEVRLLNAATLVTREAMAVFSLIGVVKALLNGRNPELYEARAKKLTPKVLRDWQAATKSFNPKQNYLTTTLL